MPYSSITILVWQEANDENSQQGNRKFDQSGLQMLRRAASKRTGLTYRPAEICGLWGHILARPPSLGR